MSKIVSDVYFLKLEKQDPLVVCKKLNCKYNSKEQCYIMSVWNDDYAILPNKKKIKRLSNNLPQHHPFLYIFIMYIITSNKINNLTYEWISEKDLSGGTTFFRGPHKIPTKLISNRFLNNLGDFKNKCKELNGSSIDIGDSAYIFKITHAINVVLVYWLGDDLFSPEAKLLFDKSIDGALPLDIIYSLAEDICARFIR